MLFVSRQPDTRSTCLLQRQAASSMHCCGMIMSAIANALFTGIESTGRSFGADSDLHEELVFLTEEVLVES